MFMNNMKEATTDAMKETTGKVVNEKEKAREFNKQVQIYLICS